MNDLPPLSKKIIRQLQADAKNLPATAKRKNVTLDQWDQIREADAAANYFELGCWLFYYSNLISLPTVDGMHHRIDCLYRIFAAGFNNPHYLFFTVFNFGERQFDTLLEMGDANTVIEHVRRRYLANPTFQVKDAFDYFGWKVDEARPIEHGQLELI